MAMEAQCGTTTGILSYTDLSACSSRGDAIESEKQNEGRTIQEQKKEQLEENERQTKRHQQLSTPEYEALTMDKGIETSVLTFCSSKYIGAWKVLNLTYTILLLVTTVTFFVMTIFLALFEIKPQLSRQTWLKVVWLLDVLAVLYMPKSGEDSVDETTISREKSKLRADTTLEYLDEVKVNHTDNSSDSDAVEPLSPSVGSKADVSTTTSDKSAAKKQKHVKKSPKRKRRIVSGISRSKNALYTDPTTPPLHSKKSLTRKGKRSASICKQRLRKLKSLSKPSSSHPKACPAKTTPHGDGGNTSKNKSQSQQSNTQNTRQGHQNSHNRPIGRESSAGACGGGDEDPNDNNRKRIKGQCEASPDAPEQEFTKNKNASKHGEATSAQVAQDLEHDHEEAASGEGRNRMTHSHSVEDTVTFKDGESSVTHPKTATYISGSTGNTHQLHSGIPDVPNGNERKPWLTDEFSIMTPSLQLSSQNIDGLESENLAVEESNEKEDHTASVESGSQLPHKGLSESPSSHSPRQPLESKEERSEENHTHSADSQQSGSQEPCDISDKLHKAAESPSPQPSHSHSKETYEEAVSEESPHWYASVLVLPPKTKPIAIPPGRPPGGAHPHAHSTLNGSTTTFPQLLEPSQPDHSDAAEQHADFPSHEVTAKPGAMFIPGTSLNITPAAEPNYFNSPATSDPLETPSLFETTSKSFQSLAADEQPSTVLEDQSLEDSNPDSPPDLTIEFPHSVDEAGAFHPSTLVTSQPIVLCETGGSQAHGSGDTTNYNLTSGVVTRLLLRCRLPVEICATYPPTEGCRLLIFAGMCARSGCLRPLLEVLLTLVQCRRICQEHGIAFAAVPQTISFDPVSCTVLLHPVCFGLSQSSEALLFTVIECVKTFESLWLQLLPVVHYSWDASEMVQRFMCEVNEYYLIAGDREIMDWLLEVLQGILCIHP